MAEFNFYGTHEDWWLYLDALVQRGGYTFVMDLWYKEPKVVSFTAPTDQVQGQILKRPVLYLWSDRYSKFPPYLEQLSDCAMIDRFNSGPALHLSLPSWYEKDGEWRLGAGWLVYEQEYRDPRTGEWYKPPPAMKEDFLTVRKLLQQLMLKRYAVFPLQPGEKKPEVQTLWIGPDAVKRLDADEAQIRIYTDWWKGSELKTRRS
jgi:hypothetical protein